jgi:anti-sigma factor RsiW
MSDQELTCRQLIEFLDDYVDGTLPQHARETFESHLGSCEECCDFLRSYRETIRLTRECCCDQAESERREVPEELVRAILAARRTMR